MPDYDIIIGQNGMMSFQFKHPSNIIIAGTSQSGKSSFLLRVLKERLIQPAPTRVLWFYGAEQPLFFREVRATCPGAEFVRGFDVALVSNIDERENNLIVVDDLMDEVRSNKVMATLFTRGSHHMNATVVFLVQNVFEQGRELRTMSLNAHYIVSFRNPRDKRQAHTLIRQLEPSNADWLIQAYDDAVSSPFGYMVINSRPDAEQELRYYSKIFAATEDQNGPVVYAPCPRRI